MGPNVSAGSRINRFFRWVLVTALLLTATAPEALATSQGTARCNNLEQQLQTALKTHTGSKAARAAALGAQARKLCASSRPALGLRTYIKAFRAIDVDPVLPKE